MKECSKACHEKGVDCPVESCRLWIDFKEDHNCCLISIEKHGEMKLRQVAERIGISYVRVKHIQDQAISKMSRNSRKEKLLCILPD